MCKVRKRKNMFLHFRTAATYVIDVKQLVVLTLLSRAKCAPKERQDRKRSSPTRGWHSKKRNPRTSPGIPLGGEHLVCLKNTHFFSSQRKKNVNFQTRLYQQYHISKTSHFNISLWFNKLQKKDIFRLQIYNLLFIFVIITKTRKPRSKARNTPELPFVFW